MQPKKKRCIEKVVGITITSVVDYKFWVYGTDYEIWADFEPAGAILKKNWADHEKLLKAIFVGEKFLNYKKKTTLASAMKGCKPFFLV